MDQNADHQANPEHYCHTPEVDLPERALTPEQKREILDRLYSAWLMAPQLRLGQLLENSVTVHKAWLFYTEDERLAEYVESFAAGIKAIQ